MKTINTLLWNFATKPRYLGYGLTLGLTLVLKKGSMVIGAESAEMDLDLTRS